MGLKRRDLLAGMGATAVGELGMMTAEKAYAEAHRTAPLQFYGGFASGIRPDLVTIDNLEAIITGLKTDGFAFTTVSELCGLSGAR